MLLVCLQLIQYPPPRLTQLTPLIIIRLPLCTSLLLTQLLVCLQPLQLPLPLLMHLTPLVLIRLPPCTSLRPMQLPLLPIEDLVVRLPPCTSLRPMQLPLLRLKVLVFQPHLPKLIRTSTGKTNPATTSTDARKGTITSGARIGTMIIILRSTPDGISTRLVRLVFTTTLHAPIMTMSVTPTPAPIMSATVNHILLNILNWPRRINKSCQLQLSNGSLVVLKATLWAVSFTALVTYPQ